MTQRTFSEEELELFVLNPDLLSEEQHSAIEEYLRHNALAREFVQTVIQFRDEMQTHASRPPSLEDERIAEKALRPTRSILSLPGAGQKELFSSTEKKQWLSVYQWGAIVRQYPVRSVAMVSLAAALVVTMVMYNRSPVDDNPAYAETKLNTLYVYNATGVVLFTKPAPGIPMFSIGGEHFNQSTRPFLVADADGDGVNEILTNLYNQSHSLSSGTVVCYDKQGNEKWRYTAYVDLANIDGGIKKATKNEVFDFMVLPATGSRNPRVFIAIADPTYSASSLVEVNALTGKTVQQYWHTGGINKVAPCDVNRDGKTDILISGINNHRKAVFVAGLDPDAMEGGTSTAYKGFFRGSVVNEMFYMLFPPSSFYLQFAYLQYNTLWSLRIIAGKDLCFEVQTNEMPPKISGDIGGGIHYIVNTRLEVSTIVYNSHFEKVYNQNRNAAQPNLPPLDQQYLDRLRSNVQWWDGAAFVSRPVFNRINSPH